MELKQIIEAIFKASTDGPVTKAELNTMIDENIPREDLRDRLHEVVDDLIQDGDKEEQQ